MKTLICIIKYAFTIIALICTRAADYAYAWVDWAEDLERWIDFEKNNTRHRY